MWRFYEPPTAQKQTLPGILRKALKIIITILLSTVTLIVTGQSIDKLTIQECYARGLHIFDKVKRKDTTGLTTLYDTVTLKRLFQLLDKKESRIFPDIYYDYRIDDFVFTIYSGQSIDNGTDWGLYSYDFILTLYFHRQNENFKIVKTITIFDDRQKKKIWWQSLMDSYRERKFLRKDWADKFGLVPPPPPPPETTEWFKRE